MNVPPDVVGLDGGDWSSETVLDDMFILTFDFHEVEGVRVATSWMASLRLALIHLHLPSRPVPGITSLIANRLHQAQHGGRSMRSL